MEFEELYNHICGYYALSREDLNIFVNGKPCASLSADAYSIKTELSRRLDEGEENEQITRLCDMYEKMQYLVAQKVYEYCISQK